MPVTKLDEKDQAILESLSDPDAPVADTFKWDQDYQREIQSILLHDRPFLIESIGLVEPEYFDNDIHRVIFSILFKFWEKYKAIPNKTQIKQELSERLKNRTPEVKAQYFSEFETILNFFVPNLEGREHYRDRIVNFAKRMAIKRGIQKVVDVLKKTDIDEELMWTEIGNILKKATSVDRDFDIGLDYFKTYQERYLRKEDKKLKNEIFTSGFVGIDNALKNGGLLRGEIGAIMGTCFRKGTRVLMFDGTTKAVEDVVIGDLLMGDDSTPRTVLTLGRGKDMMYKVEPVKGKPYYVNSQHILSLKGLNQGGNYLPKYSNKVVNISVKEYLKLPKYLREKVLRGYRASVEYSFKEILIDPYILGLWLADGRKNRITFSVNRKDTEIQNAITTWGNKIGGTIKYGNEADNSQDISVCGTNVLKYLRQYNLYENKHIPFEYIVNNSQVRLQVLAGLIDGDGHINYNEKGTRCVSFDLGREMLADNIVYMAKSLGFNSTKKHRIRYRKGTKCDVFTVLIYGALDKIPTKLLRKKCLPNKTRNNDVLKTRITVKPVGEEDYYGFSVDGNHLFLLDDFTVTHNSGSGKSLWLITAAIANLHRGKKVLYITLEIDQDAVADRFDAQLANYSGDKGITTKNLIEKKEIVFEQLGSYIKDYDHEGKTMLVVKQFASGALDMMAFRAYFQQIVLQGFRPDLVILDYVGEMKDYPNIPTHESRYRIVRDFRGFAVEEQICGLTALQPNKSGKEAINSGLVMDDENLGDSYAQVKPLDALWSINQRMDEKECCLGRMKICKHREGESKLVFPIKFNYNTLAINQITQSSYDSIYKTHMNQRKTELGDKLANDYSKVKKEGGEKKKFKFNANSEYSQEEVAPPEGEVKMMS